MLPNDQPVRLAKRTSNLFRARQGPPAATLDVSGLTGVLSIDPVGLTADVLGMTTYEDLVDATLAHGLMPLVVPQLKTITLGGAVTGLGIESSSFRNGMPHESVLELDILTGDGEVVCAAPTGDHAALFRGFPNSYGTLGYALRLRIELQRVAPFVEITHEQVATAEALGSRLSELALARSVDFLDGVVFSDHEHYVTSAVGVDHAPYVSDYTGMDIYYRSLQARRRDYLPIRDYLWRWDTDWFWCSRALGLQNPRLRRLVPKKYLRSDVYGAIIRFDRTHGWSRRIDELRGKPPREVIVQDVEVPVGRLAEFLEFFHREIGIEPIWVCPLQQRDPGVTWDLYPLEPETVYVNLGFWSSVERRPGAADGDRNRQIEEVVADLHGRKSLYSTAFYDEQTFWATYNGAAYSALKKEYDPRGRFADLYEKCVRGR